MIHVPRIPRVPYVPHSSSRHREHEPDEFATPIPMWFAIGLPLAYILVLTYFLRLSSQLSEQRKRSL
jgi:hypothetical protein